MIVYSDNKGAVDLINGWSIGGGTKHMDEIVDSKNKVEGSLILHTRTMSNVSNMRNKWGKSV